LKDSTSTGGGAIKRTVIGKKIGPGGGDAADLRKGTRSLKGNL